MSSWKHDRDYYAGKSRVFAKWSLIFFTVSIACFAIFLIEDFVGQFWIPAIVFFISGIVFARISARCRRLYFKAPSRL